MLKFKRGDKVIPHQKTAKGWTSLEDCPSWKKAQSIGQEFLYVTKFDEEEGAYCLSYSSLDIGTHGDYFREVDFTLYKKAEDKKDKKEVYTIKIPIGDWSDDGHGKCEKFTFTSNYPVEKLQEAYKASCKLTGVQFNHNEDYTGVGVGRNHGDDRLICTEYEDRSISETAVNVFKKFDCPFTEIMEDGYFEDEEEFARVILWFISLSMPEDFDYKFVEDDCTYLNGFWNEGLNVQFGYGLF